MENYDPNIVNHGTYKQRVKLVFQAWEYKAEFDIVVVGKGWGGLCAIRSAIDIVDERLDFVNGVPVLRMLDTAGNELVCDDDRMRGADWLEEMLVSAEIYEIEKVQK